YASASPAQAQARLYEWMVHCADSGVPELRRLATTIDSWTTEFLAYFTTGGITNGPTEAMNLLTKRIKRVGRHRFRNFDNYRLRLLLHCGVDCRLTRRHHSEPGYHAWLRRASNRVVA
ncbi:MAG: transposase, partial [Geodermatophilaceae bacterium]